MARAIINNSPGTADTLKVGADKINAMTDELYTADTAAAVPSLRTLGTGANQAAAGNDARLSDQRTPLDGSVTTPKIVDQNVTAPKLGFTAGPRFMARVAAGAGPGTEIDAATLTSALPTFTRSAKGLVPAAPAGTGTTNFLREDGTFAVPATAGAVAVQANGVALGSATTINFTGPNLVASFLGGVADVSFTDSSGSGTGLEVSGNVVTGADATGATSANTQFTTAARLSAGLAADGSGTLLPKEKVEMTLVPAGTFLLANWTPTDINGVIIPLKLWAFPGTAILQNKLSPISGTSGALSAIDYNGNEYQRLAAGAATCQQFSAIAIEFAPATFGFSSASSNDERVTTITVSNAAAYRLDGLVHLCSQACLPFSITSTGERVRVAEVSRILNIDTVANKIYLSGVLRYHEHFEPNIPIMGGTQQCWVTQYDETTYFECHNIEFRGAPTTVGLTTATPDQLDHGVWGFVDRSVTSITKSGTVVTVTTAIAHGFVVGNAFRLKNGNQPLFNGTRIVASVASPTVYTYNISSGSNQADDGRNIGTGATLAAASFGVTLTGTPQDITITGTNDLYSTSGTATCGATVFDYTGRNSTQFLGVTLNSGTAALPGTATAVTQSAAQVVNTATGTFLYNDAFKPGDLNNHNGCVNVKATVNPQLYNCKVIFPWSSGFRIVNSPEARVIGGEMRGLPNAGTESSNLNGGRLGYGVLFYGPSNLGLVKGVVFRNGRHPFTTDELRSNSFAPNTTSVGSTINGGDGVWYRHGGTTSVDVVECEAYDTWGIPWDTHEGSRGTRFINNRTRTTLRGPQGGSYGQFAYQIRGGEAEITNGNSEGSDYFIRFNAVPQLGVAHRVSGNSFTDLLRFALTFVSKAGADVTFTVASTAVVQPTGGSSGGPHLIAGETIRIRGANEDNYNVNVTVGSYTESTRTLVVTLPVADDRNVTFTTTPVDVGNPTGSLVVYPFARSEQVVNNFVCDGSVKGGSVAISNDSQAAFSLWRYKTRITSMRARRVMSVVASGIGTQCHVDDMTVSQIRYDGSNRSRTGCLVSVTGQADIFVAKATIDCTDSPGYPASITAASFATAADSRVIFGDLTVIQHRVFPALNKLFFTLEAVAGNPRYVGIGTLNYINPGLLTSNIQVIEPGKEGLFTWVGGGDEIYLPIRGSKVAVGATEADAAFKRMGTNFIARKWQAATRTAAAAAIGVDVKSNGTTIFGASKMTIPSAGTNSDAGTIPTYSKTYIGQGEVLTVDTTCTGSETAQGLEVTAVGWYV